MKVLKVTEVKLFGVLSSAIAVGSIVGLAE